jgi:AcrR family transcriptional regulator
MERIAEAAGMSKVTVYSYFPDKEATFAAVAQRFGDRLLQAFELALHADEPLADRVAKALLGKHLTVQNTVRRSVEARDLFAARERVAADIFEKVDQEMVARLAVALRTGRVATPDRLASLVFSAAQGIANRNSASDTMAPDIKWMVRAMLKAATIDIEGPSSLRGRRKV